MDMVYPIRLRPVLHTVTLRDEHTGDAVVVDYCAPALHDPGDLFAWQICINGVYCAAGAEQFMVDCRLAVQRELAARFPVRS